MEFKKPPVVEAWVEFKFALTEGARPWDESVAKEFVQKYFAEFKHIELFGLAKVKIDLKTGNALDTDRSLERLRAFSDSRDRCVQVGQNMVVYNQMRRPKEEWPGYDRLRDGAFIALENYANFRGLNELASVSLHYLDIVGIPTSADCKIKLEEYFTVYPELPDEKFGGISGFGVGIGLPNICKNASTTLTIQALGQVGPPYDKCRFAMDWHVTSKGGTHDKTVAREWLDLAHRDIRGAFDAAFTKRGLELFEPYGS
jgi:uncharacterized protein (TIGR04255 family)